MSGSTQTEPKTSTPQASDSSEPPPTGVEGPSEASFSEQGLSFTTTDLSLVEMTEIEYTQLQHILYSHMEAQTNEGEMEARLNSTFFSTSNPTNLPQYQSSTNANQASYTATSAGNQAVHPVVCQSALAPEGSFMGSNQCLGHIDFQELRMMLLSESNLPVNAANQVNKTPNSGSGDAPAHNVIRVKNCENSGLNKENVGTENLAPASEQRSKSAVRVRLEDRFNSIQSEIPRCQEPQESGVTLNNLVTLIRHPSELMGVPLHHQQNKCTTLVKNKATAATTALQFTYPLFTTNACSTSGNGISSQTQTNSSGSLFQSAGNPCPILEAAKHQELALPRAFSFSYQQEIESTKQTLGSRNKTLPEQVWIKVGEEALCKQAVNKRSRSRIRQLDTNLERRVLGDIQNVGDGQSSGSTQGATWQSTQAQSNQQGGSSQRRERHNRMERDRRRRIRICCDELNLLVPFCNAETDKATTLQWTTAFLKYIHERHGDSLKKEFESVFCGKTGRRLKVSRSDPTTCPVQENMQTSSTSEKK